ncbi:hypothetical protein ABZW10_38290 [Kitasatospora sp. NPDC004723]|uniref:hypothetical protein n=1 Tax=Kitasatospora sp. NPDC004723 TaxID=3154288 RepID=UPI00339ED0D0
MQPRIAVIYFSSSGVISQVAEHLAEGAAAGNAEVRVRALTAQEAPAGAGPRTPDDRLPAPTLDDLAWADGC